MKKKKNGKKKATKKKPAAKKKVTKKRVSKKKAKPKIARKRKPTKDELKQFDKEKTRAKEYIKDKRKLSALLDEALKKAERYKKILKEIWPDLIALFQLVRAWSSRKYRKVPLKKILSAVAAIVYLLIVFDVIPDFIPVAGYIDDVAVIGFVVNSIRSDLDDFLEWERTQK